MRYSREQVVAAIKALDFRSLRSVDAGPYSLPEIMSRPSWPVPVEGEICEQRDEDGELICKEQASHYHPDPGAPLSPEDAYPICEKHRCKKCFPPKRKKKAS
jgi:hypothetical protein